MKVSRDLSRRTFLKRVSLSAAGAVAAPFVIPSHIFSASPSEKIVMGCIGAGGQGMHNLRQFLNMSNVQIVSVCDVDRTHRNTAKQTVDERYGNTACMAYNDFRRILDDASIDAVTVCTPDHWHGLISIAAARAGKDIYCEKPLTNTIAEGMALRDAVKQNKVILQTGSHERSNDTVRFASELVRNGYIGDLQTILVHMPNNDPHHLKIISDTQSHPPMDIPTGFDYDFWLGHTPEVPYTEERTHFWWRFILNYGGGEMTDRGAHIIDLGQLANDTDDSGPVEFRGTGEARESDLFDTFMKYDFETTYANGVKLIGDSNPPRGLKLEGEGGWIFIHIHGGRLEAEPSSLLRVQIKPDEIHLERSPGHHQNFIDSVITRKDPMATVEIGHRTATICHLFNIAMHVNRPVTWDPVKEEITNDPEANRMISRPMRSPWTLV